ncbi:MAG TPA: MFS transporter [candidate division Zixibacteria bacterium]|nr:MFS transporter [candidate division Zixibacteria bacterium]
MNDKPSEDQSTTESLRATDSLNNHKGILLNIIIVNFFFRIFAEGFRVLLIPFAEDMMHWSDYEYGLILSIGGYAAMAFVFVLGIVVDIQFKRTTMIIGLVFTITSAIIFTRMNIFALSILFYSLFAIGQQLMMISTNTFIANETKRGQNRTFGFTGNQVSRGIANSAAPLISMYMLTIPGINFDWAFTIMAGFAGVALILVFALKLVVEGSPKDEIKYAEKLSEDSDDEFTQYESTKDGKKSILGVQISFGLGRMLMGFTSGVAIPFVGRYIYSEFITGYYVNATEVWGWINCIHWIVLTLGYLAIGVFAERIGKALIVVVSWTLVIPAAIGIVFANSLIWAAAFFIIRSFFAMTPGAAWNSFMYEWIPPKHRGKTLGLLQTGQRGMRATGTLIGGLAFSTLGPLLFPIAMTAYPIAGLLPLIQSKIVKKKMEKIVLQETIKEELVVEEEVVSHYDESFIIGSDSDLNTK